jgi:hypothetical protein
MIFRFLRRHLRFRVYLIQKPTSILFRKNAFRKNACQSP